MINGNLKLKIHDLNFDSFLFPRITHIVDAEKCDFLIVKDTNELGPQVQKILKEVAS